MNHAAALALSPFGFLYGAAMTARASFYRRGLFQTHQIAVPVISVGNLTTGGTGKTPLVDWIASRLAERGLRVCVLTRGYGRVHPHQRVMVSDGNQILAGVAQAGDEALMLAERLKGRAAVICDADRVAAANWARERLGSEVLVLDDGFQNLRIARDLNILTIDATKPLRNQPVLPAGCLREPLDAMRRADCIVLTRADESNERQILNEIQQLSDVLVIKSRMRTSQFRALNASSEAQEAQPPTVPLAAFSGIGNPKAFLNHLREEKLDLRHAIDFRDHYIYTQPDLDRIVREAKAHGAQALITTAKDEVKLRQTRLDLPGYVLDIKIEISPETKLLALIEKAILRKR